MRKVVEPGSPEAAIVAEELALWARVSSFLARMETGAPRGATPHDAELIELRDAIAEAKLEDIASLTEQMMRVAAVAAGRRGKAAGPIDAQAPYFGHLRILPAPPEGRLASRARPRRQDILIGRRGLIDRTAGVQIVDWRDAPVSQVYYRYEEGDEYEEQIPGGKLAGVIEARRNVTIQGGRLRRIGCPRGVLFCDEHDVWWQAETSAAPMLQGGQGAAARVVAASSDKSARRHPAQLGAFERPAFTERVDKHLPEIAALIDPEQFELLSQPESGLVVIQGGAGSGKTTVALHRIAYLAFRDPQRFRPKKMMVVVPSEALARYVGGVLPSLGVPGVAVTTSQAFLRAQRKRLLPRLADERNEDTPPVVARLKKHPRLLALIDDYVRDQGVELRAVLQRALDGDNGDPILRDKLLKEWDRRHREPLQSRYHAVRTALMQAAAQNTRKDLLLRVDEALRRVARRIHDVSRDFAELMTDAARLQALRTETAETAELDDPVSAQDLQELLTWCRAQQEEIEALPADVDEERYQAVDGRPLDEGSPAGRLDPEDDALLLRLYQVKHGGLDKGGGGPRFEHLVLDEAQDLSVPELKVLLDLVHKGRGGQPSVTIAGDVVQRLVFDNGFGGWEGMLSAVGLPGVTIHRLRLLYRSTIEVMDLSRAVLGPLATPESEQQAVRHGAPVAAFRFVELGEGVAFLGEALRSLMGREPTASVALIARYAATADAFYQVLQRADIPALRRVQRHEFPFTPGIDVTDVTQVKGLEFDYVVILDATESAYPDHVEARHLLHIALTRCAHQLWLLAAGPPSPLLPAALFHSDAEPAG